jgi:hypothetical protein
MRPSPLHTFSHTFNGLGERGDPRTKFVARFPTRTNLRLCRLGHTTSAKPKQVKEALPDPAFAARVGTWHRSLFGFLL